MDENQFNEALIVVNEDDDFMPKEPESKSSVSKEELVIDDNDGSFGAPDLLKDVNDDRRDDASKHFT